MNPNAPEPAQSETKDFAEHLRSVHFTLGLVCLGLIVIATQPTRPELRTAYDQARDITEVAGHLSPFHPSLFETDAVTQMDEFKKTQSPAFGRLDSLPNPPKALEINGKRYNVEFSGRNWGFLWFSPPLNTMLEAGVIDGAQLGVSSPKNLADFRLLWDGVAEVTAWGGGDLSSVLAQFHKRSAKTDYHQGHQVSRRPLVAMVSFVYLRDLGDERFSQIEPLPSIWTRLGA